MSERWPDILMITLALNDLLAQLSVGLDAVEQTLVGASPYHSKRVALLCTEIGRLLGYDEKRLFSLAGCALLHDNALTEYILSERSGAQQLLNLKSHCVLGQQNCAKLPFPSPIDGFVLYHHERADGRGCFGLTQGEFPREAGIIALADQVDVKFHLQSIRGTQLPEIRRFIREGAGTQFLPEVVEPALDVLQANILTKLTDRHIFDALSAAVPPLLSQTTEAHLIRLSEMTAKIIDYKSRFTREHSMQIANKAWYMCGLYGYPDALRAEVFYAAAVHDVGKLFIPTAILEKPGALTDPEFRIIKSHAQRSKELLSPIQGLEQIAAWAVNHHEKLDGSGYPDGKTADALDFNSRLLACLDIYQAVRETRPYHPARSHADTMAILYGMAQRGLVDSRISQDLDEALAGLKDGYAPPPDAALAH